MDSPRRPAVLCVDDDPLLLQGQVRVLRHRFAVTTAQGGYAGLEAAREKGPFAVVVADLRMPDLDGITFLRKVREISPFTVRVLLTGRPDLTAAMAAINEGHIFRFLTKPIPGDALVAGLNAAVEQYRLIVAERVLLERTLHGSINALTEILALAQPTAFGRATRAKQHVAELAAHFRVEDAWFVEIAAMLSQIGSVTLPPETAARLYRGEALSEAEQEMVDRLPAAAENLLGNIPRLEPVVEVLRYQHKHFDGSGPPPTAASGQEIPWGARALKIALDFDVLQAQGQSVLDALDTMRARNGWYDPRIFTAFAEIREASARASAIMLVPADRLEPGMVLASDVKSRSGNVLIARGQTLSTSAVARLRNLLSHVDTSTPVEVLTPKDSGLEPRQMERLAHLLGGDHGSPVGRA